MYIYILCIYHCYIAITLEIYTYKLRSRRRKLLREVVRVRHSPLRSLLFSFCCLPLLYILSRTLFVYRYRVDNA